MLLVPAMSQSEAHCCCCLQLLTVLPRVNVNFKAVKAVPHAASLSLACNEPLNSRYKVLVLSQMLRHISIMCRHSQGQRDFSDTLVRQASSGHRTLGFGVQIHLPIVEYGGFWQPCAEPCRAQKAPPHQCRPAKWSCLDNCSHSLLMI